MGNPTTDPLRSFFGGNPNEAYFTVRLPFQPSVPRSEREASRERRRAEEAALVEAGFRKETRFRFNVHDPKAKARAQKQADALVARVGKAGIVVKSYEGFDL